MATQSEIAKRCGIDVSSVNKILNRRKGPIFRASTIKKVFQVARQLGYDIGRLKHNHERTHPRKPSDLPLELSIYLADGRLFDRGRAVLRDVSLSGALLSGILLTEKKGLPLQPHTIGIKLLDGPLKDLEIRSEPVRFLHRQDGVHLAVAFQAVDASSLEQLRKIV